MQPLQPPNDPTYGYDLKQLLAVPAPEGPADFAEFWKNAFEEARAVPLRIERREISSSFPGIKVFEVEFDSLDGVRIGGWITVPSDGKFTRGIVAGHGYGGRGGPSPSEPGPAAVAIYPCARGFDRSARKDIPRESAGHVLHGIGSRETYIFRGCATDLWCAASALIELYPQVADTLDYMGGSFGGGIGALALPWDNRFRRGYLDVPSFGNHPLRVQLPCVGSGESVRRYYKHHPEVMDVLAYFDSATAARHTRIPVFVSAALSDPAVPPPGQFAVYNGLAGPRELYVRKAAHSAYPEEAQEGREMWARLAEWFAI